MWKVSAACALAALALAGCAYDDGYYHRDGYRDRHEGRYYDGCRGDAAAGTVVGGVAGGVIGNQFGSGGGRAAATVGGVLLGAIIGNSIARDACRDDRADAYYYNRTYDDAFDEPSYGRRYGWRNPHNGHYGYVTPTREYRNSRYGNHCEEFRHVVYVGRNRTEEETGIACRQRNGSWRIYQDEDRDDDQDDD
jgi:surface antigen